LFSVQFGCLAIHTTVTREVVGDNIACVFVRRFTKIKQFQNLYDEDYPI
jgi:hypothetical protein